MKIFILFIICFISVGISVAVKLSEINIRYLGEDLAIYLIDNQVVMFTMLGIILLIMFNYIASIFVIEEDNLVAHPLDNKS